MGQSQINNDYMLSSSVKKRSQIHLQQQNWTLLEKPEVDRQQLGSFGIYKNQVTGEVAREYSLNLQSKKALKSYVDQFDYWRSQIRCNVLESKYIVFEEQSFGLSQLCSKYYPVKIYVQNPVVTLAEIKDIPVPQGLYIILSSLMGFQHLFQVFGYFALTQSMITINEHGIVKVWIHPNLSSNRPLSIGLNEISQADIDCPDRFIREIIQMIDSNIDYGDLDVNFGSYINKKYKKYRKLDFSHCRKHLLNFAQQLQVDLPDSLLTILDLLFDKTNRTSISEQDLSQHNGPALYGKNFENKYLLGEDFQNQDERKFNVLQNVQSPSQNSQFPHRSPSDQIGSFYPQNMQVPIMRNSTQQLSIPSQNSNQKNLPRNYSYKESNNMVSEDPNLVYQNPNHRRSFPAQIFTPQEKYVTQNQNVKDFIENPYSSLVQRQHLEKQSTIRQEIEQDSFLTSYKNGKFQSSKDLKKPSNLLKRHSKNVHSHINTINSQSDSKLVIQNIENLQFYQGKMKQQSTKNINLNISQLSMTKKSQKSIQFHTLYEVKQLDAEIAEDLQKMLSGIAK